MLTFVQKNHQKDESLVTKAKSKNTKMEAFPLKSLLESSNLFHERQKQYNAIKCNIRHWNDVFMQTFQEFITKLLKMNDFLENFGKFSRI